MPTLNYNKEKDCLCIDGWPYHQVLFESYDDSGYSHNKPMFFVPETDFGIQIASNFGYGNASYLRVRMQYRGVPIFNFSNWHDSKHCTLTYFEVSPNSDSWCELFKQIITVYDERESWNNNHALVAIERLLGLMLNLNDIEVRINPKSINLTTLKGEAVVLHFAMKTEELIQAMETAKIERYTHIKDGLDSICEKMLSFIPHTYKQIMGSIEVNKETNTKNKEKLESAYNTIYEYLKRTNHLDMILGRNLTN